MQNKLFLFLCILIFLLVAACRGSTGQDMEKIPGIDLTVEEMNTDLHLQALSDNTYQLGDSIWLMLFNTSDLRVVLPHDYGVHIFQYADSSWEPISNRIDSSTGNKWVFENGDSTHRWDTVIVDPNILSSEPTQIRIVIIGNFVKENGRLGKNVGTYIDLTLYPEGSPENEINNTHTSFLFFDCNTVPINFWLPDKRSQFGAYAWD